MNCEEREKKTLDARIEKFVKLGQDKYGKGAYDYSLAEKEYVNNRTPVHLICNRCSNPPFTVYPFMHTSKGENNYGSCQHCNVPDNKIQEKRWDPNLQERIKDFVTQVNSKYKNSLILPYVEDEYRNESSRITVSCKKCKSEPFTRLARSLKAQDRIGGCKVCNKKENQEKTNETIRERQLRNHATKDEPRDYGCIYKITNTKNDNVYIGYTTMTAQKRFKAHMDETRRMDKGHKEKSSYLHNAMKHHGFEHFKVEVLEEFTNVTPLFLGNLEMKYIAKNNPDYNLSPGGELA